MSTEITISAGAQMLGFHSSLSTDEMTAFIAAQAAINVRAKEELIWAGIDPKDPCSYISDRWLGAVEQAIYQVLMNSTITGRVDKTSKQWSFDPPSNISQDLLSVMSEYIPGSSQEQCKKLIEILTRRQFANSPVEECLGFWSNNWIPSASMTSFGFGPAWKKDDDDIATTMSFFSISVGHADWERVFSDVYREHVEVHASKFQLIFSFSRYQRDDELGVRTILGGSIQDRIRHAPLG
jgi:hypothetical protein